MRLNRQKILLYSIRLIFWILFFLGPLIFDRDAEEILRVPKEYFHLGLLIPALGLWIALKLEEGKFYIVWTRFHTFLVLFGIWGVISALYSTVPAISRHSLRNLIVYIPACFIFMDTTREKKNILAYGAAVFFATVISSLYSIIQYYGFDPIFEPIDVKYSGRWLAGAFIGQATLFGGYLAAAIPLLMALFILVRKRFIKYCLIFGIIISLLSLLCTHTRAVFLGMGISFAYVLFLMRLKINNLYKRQKRIIILFMLGGLMIIVPFVILNPTIGERVAKISQLQSDSIGGRVWYTRVMADMIRDKPVLGFGLGTFQHHYYEYHSDLMRRGSRLRAYVTKIVTHAHNEYLQVFVETGAVGFILLAAAFVFYFRYAILMLNYIKNEKKRLFCLILSGAAAVLAVDAGFSFPFHIAPSAFLGIAVVGINFSWYLTSEAPDENS